MIIRISHVLRYFASRYTEWLLLMVLLISPSHARQSTLDTTLQLLHQEGTHILSQLAISHPAELYRGLNFSQANITWVFHKEDGIDNILQQIADAKTDFHRVHVLPQQMLFIAQRDNADVLLWIKRHQNNGFSGSLNIMAHGSQHAVLEPLPWIPSVSQVLLDQETSAADIVHQWIYLLPFDQRQVEKFMQAGLDKYQWGAIKSSQGKWHKQNQQLWYSVHSVDGKTALYVSKTRVKP